MVPVAGVMCIRETHRINVLRSWSIVSMVLYVFIHVWKADGISHVLLLLAKRMACTNERSTMKKGSLTG
jgi:hypothetical protein